MSEIMHRFTIQYSIPESNLKVAQTFIDMILKGIEGLKPYSKDIVGTTGTVEVGTSAKYHACQHEIGGVCGAEQDIEKLSISEDKDGKVGIGTAKVVAEPIEEIKL